jgi:hexosaminidase
MNEPKLNLIPYPQQLTQHPGTFAFHNDAHIVLAPAHAQSVLGAAQGLLGAAQDLLGAAQRLRDTLAAEAATSVQISAGEIGDPADVALALSIDPGCVPQPQGYTIEVTAQRITVVGHDAPGAFYAVCTLNQLIRQFGAQIPCLSIADHPDFPARGVMLDVSRCKVPSLDTLLNLADMLAGFKVNQLQLYTEHTFAYRDHREVWANASPLTGQEILELDAYCRERFIELVPNQNSFGHMVPWLTHPRYSDLAEAPDGFDSPWGGHRAEPFSLNPTDPRSLDLLRGLYDDLLPHFSSRLFNVGCDETIDLGQGRSRAACEEKGTHRVYLDFLLQIYRLVQERGRTMMFWGDIIVQAPELIPELPHDAIALEWGYEHDHAFDERCGHFARAGIPFYVCPGTSSWNAVAGRTENALGNLRNAAESGLRHGAIGYLNTDWGDNGHWQVLPTAYLGYAYGAAVSWAVEANAELDLPPALSLHAFNDPTGTMGQLAYDLGNVYQIWERATGRRIHNANFLVRVLYEPVEELKTRHMDWADVPAEPFSEARHEIDTVMARLPQARMWGKDADLIRREYENAARLLRHACALGEMKIAQANGQTVADQAAALAEDMRAILAEHRALWLARNRVGGLEEGSAAHFQRMIAAYRRIAAAG